MLILNSRYTLVFGGLIFLHYFTWMKYSTKPNCIKGIYQWKQSIQRIWSGYQIQFTAYIDIWTLYIYILTVCQNFIRRPAPFPPKNPLLFFVWMYLCVLWYVFHVHRKRICFHPFVRVNNALTMTINFLYASGACTCECISYMTTDKRNLTFSLFFLRACVCFFFCLSQ